MESLSELHSSLLSSFLTFGRASVILPIWVHVEKMVGTFFEDHKQAVLQIGRYGILAALSVRILQTISAISIIWATAVVLGAFAPDIKESQFVWVSSLLLVEGLRMVAMSNVTLLFTRQLVTHLGPPAERINVKKDIQYVGAVTGWTLLAAIQIVVALAAAVLSAVQLSMPARAYAKDAENGNLAFGVRVFYGLMILECGLSILSLSIQCVFVSFTKTRAIWLEYYFEVFEETFEKGLASPNLGGFVEFGMKSLAACHQSAMTAKNIYEWHEEFVSYLSKARDGMEVVLLYLSEGDRYEREAAANLIGFWKGDGMSFLNIELLDILFSKVGPGKVGRAIALSLSVVVVKNPKVMEFVSDDQLACVAMQLNTCLVQAKSKKDSCYLKCAVAIVDVLKEHQPNRQQAFISHIRRDHVLQAADTGENQNVISWAVLLLLLIGEEDASLERQARAEATNGYLHDEDKRCVNRVSELCGEIRLKRQASGATVTSQ